MAVLYPAEDVPLFPNGGWDTHHHIFEPETFPYCPNRHLTPPAATVTAFHDFTKKLGITNSVLTHGLSYGDDCSSLMAFVSRLGQERTSAIAVFDPIETTDEELLRMHKAGVRGARVNLYKYRAMEDVELQKIALRAHVEKLSALSLPWVLTMTTIRTEFWDDLAPMIKASFVGRGVELITDHFGLLKAPSMLLESFRKDPTSQPGFVAIMDLVRSGHLWVKLSAPYRVSEAKPEYHDLKFLVRALVDANKYRVLWGSDWPHTPRMKVRTPEEALRESPYLDVNDDAWLRSLRSWLSDEEWHLLMVKNPEGLFGAK